MSVPLPIVLAPGMLCDARLWAPVQAMLEARSSVVALDAAASLDEMASAILAAAAPRFVLAGFSMGGMAALLAAGRAPERVVALAILSTHADTDTPARAALRRGQIEAAENGRFAALVAGLPALYFANPDALSGESALVQAMAHGQGAAVFARHVRALLERPDLARAAAGLRLPAEVMGGAEDRVATPEQATRLATLIPGARLTLVPACGHALPLEAPSAVAARLDHLCARSAA